MVLKSYINILKNESTQIDGNIQLLRDVKENAIFYLEEKKVELRKKCDPTINFRKPTGVSGSHISVKQKDKALIVIEK